MSLRKSFLSYKTCKGLGEDLHFKWAEKEVIIYVFSSECCKEREVRANNQEKNLSKVQLSQGECEAILVSIIIVFTAILTFFSFSKQKNFLLVGTADGNLAIFEDKTVKVNIEHILHQNLIVLCLFITSLLLIINSLTPRIVYSVSFLFIASESLVHNRFFISTW